MDGAFSVEDLADLIQSVIGDGGLWVFGLGFIAAALSSMLTVPLGAALTADSMFTEKEDGERVKERRRRTVRERVRGRERERERKGERREREKG